MSDVMEPVEQFRARARAWLKDNMPLAKDAPQRRMEEPAGPHFERCRMLQGKLWEGGFAGICWPKEYGGLGLSMDHLRAFNEEAEDYELPLSLNVPTFGILGATLVEHGSHEQKLEYVPKILSGEHQWVQFLSEPSGGSDLAGVLTRADRDGDTFVINGSKIWSSFAEISDYCMLLARTNWDVPKHRGLTMFIVKIHQPGIQIEPIRMTYGSAEFCQEFFTDVVVSKDAVVGEVDQGWTVASSLLLQERISLGGASKYTVGKGMNRESSGIDTSLIRLARQLGQDQDPITRQAIAEYHAVAHAHHIMSDRVTRGMAKGVMSPSSGSLLKLAHAITVERHSQLAIEIGGAAMAVGGDGRNDARDMGNRTLTRQGIALGGGSNEIQRNIISERVLNMPREWAGDVDIPYRDVRRSGGGATGPKQ